MDYCLGLAFNSSRSTLVLIGKQSPAWQWGLLNGVGGKIEAQEHARTAMVREFWEETGVRNSDDCWVDLGALRGPGYSVFLWCLYSDAIHQCRTTTAEQIVFARPHDLPANVVPNLLWLVPAALRRYYEDFRVEATFR